MCIFNFRKKLIASEFIFKENCLFVKKNKTEIRQLQSVLQFGVGVVSNFLTLNSQLVLELFRNKFNFIYFSDDSFEKRLFISSIHQIKPEDNILQHDLLASSTDFTELNTSQEQHVFLTSDNYVGRFTNDYVLKFKNNLFDSLHNLNTLMIKKPLCVVITLNTELFNEADLQRIHEIVKNLKEKNIIVIVSLNDYGHCLQYTKNFLGNNIYDEIWITNLGEGINIYPHINEVYKLPFFNFLPDLLKKYLNKESKLLNQSYKYFKNGSVINIGSVVLLNDGWYFEPIGKSLYKLSLSIK